MTTLAQALSEATALLGESSGSARADALLLFEGTLGRPREWILAFGESRLPERTAAQFLQACLVRRSGMPVAYVLGSAGFYGRELAVNRSVLIPRPETEHLIDEAVRFIRGPMHVLDVGTGCGAIACTIASETTASVDATDSSQSAIEIARENARRLGLLDRVRFHHGDLAEPVTDRRFDVIIANLPYVPTADLPKPPEPASFEPRKALDGGPDGLRLYRRLLKNLTSILTPKSLVLLEAAPPTMAALSKIVHSTLPDFTISVGHDYAGLARYIKAQG